MTADRCPTCDRPISTGEAHDDEEFWCSVDLMRARSPDTAYGLTDADLRRAWSDCQAHRVDWRARARTAETALVRCLAWWVKS